MQMEPAGQQTEHESVSDWFTGIMIAVFGLVGLLMASGARDIEIDIFGWSLAAFSLVFVAGLVRKHFDVQDRVAVKVAHHE
jgi:hypothetical protein